MLLLSYNSLFLAFFLALSVRPSVTSPSKPIVSSQNNSVLMIFILIISYKRLFISYYISYLGLIALLCWSVGHHKIN